ncbi:MAG: FeoA family protein [Desulfotomaculales bacterium]
MAMRFGSFRKRNPWVSEKESPGQRASLNQTLDGIEKGQYCRILSMPDGIIRAQALRLGISEGEIVACREKVPAGPVVIAKNRQEIAIGRRLARLIKVTRIEPTGKKRGLCNE